MFRARKVYVKAQRNDDSCSVNSDERFVVNNDDRVIAAGSEDAIADEALMELCMAVRNSDQLLGLHSVPMTGKNLNYVIVNIALLYSMFINTNVFVFLDASQFLFAVVQILLHLPQFLSYYFAVPKLNRNKGPLDDHLELIFFAVWNFSSEGDPDYLSGLYKRLFDKFCEDPTVLASHERILTHLFDNIGQVPVDKCRLKVRVERDACPCASFESFKYLTITIPCSAANTGLETYLQHDATFSTLSKQECGRCKNNTTGN